MVQEYKGLRIRLAVERRRRENNLTPDKRARHWLVSARLIEHYDDLKQGTAGTATFWRRVESALPETA